MTTWLFYVLSTWLVALVAVLAVHGTRAKTTVDRVLALDTLSLVFIAALALFAVRRGRSAYLDVALMLAMVSFSETLATSRYSARHEARR